MNEPLRQALLRAGLREDDVAAQLGVDPKTVRRWLSGRVPYPNSRAALANLVGANEADLWPDAGGPLTSRTRPEELAAVYPHRWAIPRDVWKRLFESAEREISVLAYSALFLAEDADMLAVIAGKARSGVRVRLALGDPDSPAVVQRGQEEGIGYAMAAKIRNALTLYRASLKAENVEIRLHDTVLYNSLYRADDQLFVNQHAYGLPAAHAPVFCLRRLQDGNMSTTYLKSFENVWSTLPVEQVTSFPLPLVRIEGYQQARSSDTAGLTRTGSDPGDGATNRRTHSGCATLPGRPVAARPTA